MFRAFSNIPIFRRLAITFAVATFIPILVILLLGNLSLQSSETRSQAVKTSFDAQNIATQEQIHLQQMNALLQARFAQLFVQGNLLAGGDPSSRKLTENDISTLETGFNQALASYQRNYDIDTSSNMNTIRGILISDATDHGQGVMTKQQAALDIVSHTAWPHYKTLINKLLEDFGRNTYYLAAYGDYYQEDLGFLELKNVWQQVVETATEMGTTVTQVGPSLINPLIFYISGSLIFTLLVVIAAGFLINSTIISPLNLLVSLARRIEKGDTYARAEIRGSDEINRVAFSMNVMLDHILHLMQEAQSSHALLQAQIEKMANEVSGVGEGNLQLDLQVTSSELGVLADSFNVMAGQLNNLVVNVKTLARGVQKATLQAFGYTEQLVDNADTQIQQMAQAGEEVSYVAISSRQVAERARVLSNVAYEARHTALRGQQSVQQTIKGMERINENVSSTSKKVLSLGERSREISSIVEVISSIAQQTNRLALDASIQAAMAGDHGKGFGAVAVDIRRLAERAKEQSALVVQIVRNVLEDISASALAMQETERETASGTGIVQEVGKAFEQVFSVVERQADEIETTNEVATQQLDASNRAVQIMQYVSDSTRQSNAITRSVTLQIEHLAKLAGQLLISVEVFKLHEDRSQYTVTTETPPYPGRKQLAANRRLLPLSQPGSLGMERMSIHNNRRR